MKERNYVAKERVEIPADHVVILYCDLPHSVDALEDSSFLLTIAWHELAC